MQKKNFLVLAALAVVAGCAKSPDPAPEKIHVRLNVSTPLSVTEEPITKAGDLHASITTIYYGIAKDNALVLSGSQASNVAGFGTIDLELNAGTYDLFLYATGTGSPGTFTYTPAGIPSSNRIESKNSEVFANVGDLTVAQADQTIDKALSRAVGGLVFHITDDVPEAVSRVVVSYQEKYIAVGKGIELQPTTYAFSKIMTIDNNKVEDLRTFVLPQTLAPIKVRAFASDNTILVDKEIESLTVLANKRYTISGTLFESVGQRSFSITVEDDWDSEETVNL